MIIYQFLFDVFLIDFVAESLCMFHTTNRMNPETYVCTMDHILREEKVLGGSGSR